MFDTPLASDLQSSRVVTALICADFSDPGSPLETSLKNLTFASSDVLEFEQMNSLTLDTIYLNLIRNASIAPPSLPSDLAAPNATAPCRVNGKGSKVVGYPVKRGRQGESSQIALLTQLRTYW